MKKHVIFDVDGTLVNSCQFDSEIYFDSINRVLKIEFNSQTRVWKNVTDSGVLNEIIDLLGLSKKREEIYSEVKSIFVKKISDYISTTPVIEVKGASRFIEILKEINDLKISIATGGWSETAIMKLHSAGIDISGIPIVSSNDHYIRTEIMKLSAAKANNGDLPEDCTYFGDAAWDKKACQDLEWSFILVGEKIVYSRRIDNFDSPDTIMALLDS